MGIPVDALFYIFLVVISIISFLGGLFVMKKSNGLVNGFWTSFGVSILSLVFLFSWFQSAASDAFMGTIPWLFNQAVAIVLYIIYIINTWFVLKKINKKRLLN